MIFKMVLSFAALISGTYSVSFALGSIIRLMFSAQTTLLPLAATAFLASLVVWAFSSNIFSRSDNYGRMDHRSVMVWLCTGIPTLVAAAVGIYLSSVADRYGYHHLVRSGVVLAFALVVLFWVLGAFALKKTEGRDTPPILVLLGMLLGIVIVLGTPPFAVFLGS